MSTFLAVLLASGLVFADVTNVRRCSKGQPFPLQVDVAGCSVLPCNVVKGTPALMNVKFVGTKDDIKSLQAKVKATALDITVPYALPEDVANVCANLANGATCPIDQDEDVIYNFNFYVDSSYPEIPVTVQVSLIDENNDSVACFVADIRVRK